MEISAKAWHCQDHDIAKVNNTTHYEEVLSAAGQGQKLTVTDAKAKLRKHGPPGQLLAARLTRLSKARNVAAHPDISLAAEVRSLLAGADKVKEQALAGDLSTAASGASGVHSDHEVQKCEADFGGQKDSNAQQQKDISTDASIDLGSEASHEDGNGQPTSVGTASATHPTSASSTATSTIENIESDTTKESKDEEQKETQQQKHKEMPTTTREPASAPTTSPSPSSSSPLLTASGDMFKYHDCLEWEEVAAHGKQERVRQKPRMAVARRPRVSDLIDFRACNVV